MSELQKYTAQHISQDTEQNTGGRRMMFGPERVYLAKDADATIADLQAKCAVLHERLASAAKIWRCFHCGEVCKSEVDARNHFGAIEGSEPACSIKAAGEFALLKALRNAEDRLQRYAAEDSDTLRAMSAMQSDHQQALIREEERGYAKGLDDMRERLAAKAVDCESLHSHIDQLLERLARSEAANALHVGFLKMLQPMMLLDTWKDRIEQHLAVADGQKHCEHRATHPGMPKDQPCHYCDGTATVSGEHPDDADEAVFTAQEQRIAELEASLDNARSQLKALRLKAAMDPELRPAFDDQCGGG